MLCPSCGATVSIESGLCEFCGRDLRTPSTSTAPRPLAPRSAKYHVDDDGLNLEISWRWFTPAVFFMAFFAVGWNAFLVGWFVMASSMPDEMGVMRWIFMLFPIIHVAVGVGLIYGVLVAFVNSTRIRVDRGELTVRHGPIYFPGEVTLDTSEIDQLYVSQEEHRSKDGIHFSATLRARTRDNRVIDLIKNMVNASDASYLEQTLEKHLKIADRRVAGEIAHT